VARINDKTLCGLSDLCGKTKIDTGANIELTIEGMKCIQSRLKI
jgi:hypothetical protein